MQRNRMTPNQAATTTARELGRSPTERGTARLAADLGDGTLTPNGDRVGFNASNSEPVCFPTLSADKKPVGYVWCGTDSPTPRKHAQPGPATQPAMRIILGNGLEDRKVECSWFSDGIRSTVSVNVATLRKMIEAAEAYKPGATLTGCAK